jgi:hypothetical protein
MPKTASFLLIIFASILFCSCSTSQKITSLLPEPDNASPLVYENTPSFITLPITVKLQDIENQTNLFLNGLIYQDNNIDDDDIEIKVWKLAPISIIHANEKSGDRIKITLPLKALVKYRVGTKTLGTALYTTREFNLSGVVTLISDVSLTNWRLDTKTEISSLIWNESPSTTIFGKNIPVTYLINPAIKLFKSQIERKIDEAVEKSMNFKPNVMEALEKVCEPFQMNESYESWLRIIPLEIYSTTAKLKGDQFSLQMGMKCNIETLIGNKPESKFDINKIILKSITKIPKQITANIIAVSAYNDASKIMKKNFAGQEFESGNKKVKVKDVAIWHKNGKIVIALDLLGTVNGKIYLTGFPQYDDKTKEIYFDELDYVLDTKNKLMRTADWLAQGLILRKIKENCRYSIKTNLDEGKKTIVKYLQNYCPMTGVFINGTVEDIQFQKVQLTNNAIIAFLKVNGEINVSINGLK